MESYTWTHKYWSIATLSVRTPDAIKSTYQKRWTGQIDRESKDSGLLVYIDDDDDDDDEDDDMKSNGMFLGPNIFVFLKSTKNQPINII